MSLDVGGGQGQPASAVGPSNVIDGSHLLPALQARSAEVAEHWYAAIARTGFAPRTAAAVRGDLRTLTEQLVAALVSEPVAREAARAAGVALAQLHYVHPDALGGTLEALGKQVLAGLPPEQVSILQPRLASLLGAVASGFMTESQAMILEEQDQIRQALFVTRHQVEAAEQARTVAEAAVRVRTDVLNAAAHDLRGPLTSVRAQADLLRRRLQRGTPPPEWLQARAEAISAGITRMDAMVDELLDVARLQLGQTLQLRLAPVDVGTLVQTVARPREANVEYGGPPVLVDAPAGLMVDADRARLERVVDNLISNAVKYSPQGTPVHVEVRPQEAGVAIEVRDQGVGIPASELPHIFTPFYRASTARGIPGMGIGLAGAKAIVEQHGGRIAVESASGQGTSVVLTLPSAPTSAEEAAPPTPAGEASRG
ncbi:MAG: sensor histidine kinase [Chloroflexota bacterium]